MRKKHKAGQYICYENITVLQDIAVNCCKSFTVNNLFNSSHFPLMFKMKFFLTIVNSFQPLTIVTLQIVDMIWLWYLFLETLLGTHPLIIKSRRTSQKKGLKKVLKSFRKTCSGNFQVKLKYPKETLKNKIWSKQDYLNFQAFQSCDLKIRTETDWLK